MTHILRISYVLVEITINFTFHSKIYKNSNELFAVERIQPVEPLNGVTLIVSLSKYQSVCGRQHPRDSYPH